MPYRDYDYRDYYDDPAEDDDRRALDYDIRHDSVDPPDYYDYDLIDEWERQEDQKGEHDEQESYGV